MIRGVVFDLDGVLADTERLHWEAYREILGPLRVEVGIEEYRTRFIARGGGPAWACEHFGLPFGPDELKRRKAPVYLELLRDRVTACAGAREALLRMGSSYAVAVATNSTRDEVDVVFARLGFAPLVRAAIVREDYATPKPAPDAYATAAAALGLPPAECVAVEDTERGTRSAHAAGLRVVAVPSDLTFDNDFSLATWRIPHLDNLTPTLFAKP